MDAFLALARNNIIINIIIIIINIIYNIILTYHRRTTKNLKRELDVSN